MKTIRNISEVNAIMLDSIKDIALEKGYQIREQKEASFSSGGNLVFENEHVKFTCGYSVSGEYSFKEREFDYFQIYGFMTEIIYPPVEKIILPILQQNNLFGNSLGIEDITRSFSPPQEFNHILKDEIKLKYISEVIVVAKKFKSFYLEDALPLFDKWKDLRKVNEFTNGIPQEDINTYFNFAVFKKAIIWKLCNNSKFEEYFNWLYFGLVESGEQNTDNDEIWKRYAQAVIDLKRVLSNVKPVYI